MKMSEMREEFFKEFKPESKEIQTPEGTKTVYKTFSARERHNDVLIHWVEKSPMKVETTVEDAKKLLRERQRSLLAVSKEYIKEAKRALADAEKMEKFWQEQLEKEPTVTDGTVEQSVTEEVVAEASNEPNTAPLA